MVPKSSKLVSNGDPPALPGRPSEIDSYRNLTAASRPGPSDHTPNGNYEIERTFIAPDSLDTSQLLKVIVLILHGYEFPLFPWRRSLF